MGDRSFSVRGRLVLAVAGLVAAALVVTGFTVSLLESRRIDAAIDANITQEFAEFRSVTSEDSADARLNAYLTTNLPDSGEIFWAFRTDGSIEFVGDDATALQRAANFPTTVRSLLDDGGLRDLTVDGTTYRLGVLPLYAGEDRAALVVTIDPAQRRADLADLMVTYSLLAAFSLVVILAISTWLVGRLLAPLRRLRDTAQSIGAGATGPHASASLGERLEVTGHDDLTDLQRTFNAMLDRIEDAMTAQRAMLDDAAHELRTPLTVIRGQLEVVDTSDPEDLAATRALVLDEVDRMSRLVSDLLLLAKSGRPDFVRRSTTDVGALVDGVFARLQTLADREWALDANTEIEADVDGQRLVQAMLALADNAVRHTRAGDQIGIGARVADGALELWVRDTGTGVPDELRDSLFERFSQGSESEGFGLGLSIVRAIAEAHGGTVVLDPPDPARPGATFRLRLPTGWIA